MFKNTIFEKNWKKLLFSYNNNTALTKQIYLFDTNLIMTNTYLSYSIQINKEYVGQNSDMV